MINNEKTNIFIGFSYFSQETTSKEYTREIILGTDTNIKTENNGDELRTTNKDDYLVNKY